MISFQDFLLEANKAGSKFEIAVAQNVKHWLHVSNLDNEFQAERYQNASDDLEGRSEDYSDIIVHNLNDGTSFFIECKQAVKTNIVTTQFDINDDFSLTPVSGKSRTPLEDDISNRLAHDIQRSDEYLKFVKFLTTPNKFLNGNCPSSYYFNEIDVTDGQLGKAINKYNHLVDDGLVEADCKKFDLGTIRETTRNMLICGLCWRLFDESNTWDICHVEDIPYFSELVRQHYLEGKNIPAKYIQMNDELFVTNANDNPFNIDCTAFPNDIVGRFDLKFTPRFGSGSMYITPRSKILSDISSNSSFIDKERWPSIR